MIAVTGSLPSYIPRFEEQLAPGGRLFVIVGTAPAMEAMLITRQLDGEFTRVPLYETSLKALVGATPNPKFTF